MSNFNYLPIAVADADHTNPTIMLNLLNILCDVIGLPRNDSCRAIAHGEFPLTKVENCVGNPDSQDGVDAGSTWWISNNSGKNILGDNISQAQYKLDNAKFKKLGDTLIGEITEYGNEWFKEWGIVTADEPEVI